jgi:hypothetical protein
MLVGNSASINRMAYTSRRWLVLPSRAERLAAQSAECQLSSALPGVDLPLSRLLDGRVLDKKKWCRLVRLHQGFVVHRMILCRCYLMFRLELPWIMPIATPPPAAAPLSSATPDYYGASTVAFSAETSNKDSLQ